MASTQAPEPMAAEAASRLMEFARGCKAAIKVVSMYPASHPTIETALARMVAAGTSATANGPLTLTVLPEALLVSGHGLPKPDTAVQELAALLHGHQIGELTIAGPLTPAGWHQLLSLLAKPPEEIRRIGGITQAWKSTSHGPVEIREIDYGEVLKERSGGAMGADTEWQTLIASYLAGDQRGALDERTLASLLDIAHDADRLGEFLNRLQERARGTGQATPAQRESVVKLLEGLANYAAEHSADDFDQVMDNVASGATRLSPDLMLSLLAASPPAAGPGGMLDAGVDLGGELRARFSEDRLAAFVAENVVRDRGATSRLAEAFHALAPADTQRATALALAEERVSLSPLGAEPQFNDVWAQAMSILMSYSDADFVPDAYDRELNTAREMAIEIEQLHDDPPDRVAAWMSTVADADLRALDQQLLVDLLRLEDRPEAWLSVLDLALTRLEQLVLVGDLRLAHDLLSAIAGVAHDPRSPFATRASVAIAGLTTGPIVKHLMLYMRQASDDDVPMLQAFCQQMGPGVIGALTTGLATEESRLAVRRVKDVLIGFGQAAREPARALRDSANPAVRRVAIEVLREVGGAEALPDLEQLLADDDSNVQREALRAIVQIGTPDAYTRLEAALERGDPRTREAVMHMIGSFADERAAPLLVHLLRHSSIKNSGEAAYVALLDALGRSGAHPRAIDALKDVLYAGGDWWAPMRTARIRAAAARALHQTASPAGDAILHDASTSGPRGVRQAATQAMALPRKSRPSGAAQ